MRKGLTIETSPLHGGHSNTQVGKKGCGEKKQDVLDSREIRWGRGPPLQKSKTIYICIVHLESMQLKESHLPMQKPVHNELTMVKMGSKLGEFPIMSLRTKKITLLLNRVKHEV